MQYRPLAVGFFGGDNYPSPQAYLAIPNQTDNYMAPIPIGYHNPWLLTEWLRVVICLSNRDAKPPGKSCKMAG